MGLEAVYQKPRLSRKHPEHRIYPYLLRNLDITRPNQVWCSGITYSADEPRLYLSDGPVQTGTAGRCCPGKLQRRKIYPFALVRQKSSTPTRGRLSSKLNLSEISFCLSIVKPPKFLLIGTRQSFRCLFYLPRNVHYVRCVSGSHEPLFRICIGRRTF